MPRKFRDFTEKDIIRFYENNLSNEEKIKVEQYFLKKSLERPETPENVAELIFDVLDAVLALKAKYRVIWRLLSLIGDLLGVEISQKMENDFNEKLA